MAGLSYGGKGGMARECPLPFFLTLKGGWKEVSPFCLLQNACFSLSLHTYPYTDALLISNLEHMLIVYDK